MYLQLSSGFAVPERDVIGIFDLDNCSQSHITRDFLTRAQKTDSVITVCDDLPKSFVICGDEKDMSQKVYLSQYMTSTIQKNTFRTRQARG